MFQKLPLGAVQYFVLKIQRSFQIAESNFRFHSRKNHPEMLQKGLKVFHHHHLRKRNEIKVKITTIGYDIQQYVLKTQGKNLAILQSN